jgi:succinate dehydrogenase / fumarate reductase cytochrome b subunit
LTAFLILHPTSSTSITELYDMLPLTTTVWSSVGKKIMTGVTGLGLCVFIIEHLFANFKLFVGADAFNLYTHNLMDLGWLLYVVEGLLAFAFLLHATVGISIWLKKRQARPVPYAQVTNAGDPSRKSIYSVSMIYTGVLLLIFLILHLKTFKYGPYYSAYIDGVGEVRDLYRLVLEVYRDPIYVIFYTILMILLGVHLRHGFWSAFQSLGVSNPRLTPVIYSFGILFAVVMGAGFLVMPIWIYFTH